MPTAKPTPERRIVQIAQGERGAVVYHDGTQRSVAACALLDDGTAACLVRDGHLLIVANGQRPD